MARQKNATYTDLGGSSAEAVIYGAGAAVLMSGSTVMRLSDRQARTFVVEWLRHEAARRPAADVAGAVLRDAGIGAAPTSP